MNIPKLACGGLLAAIVAVACGGKSTQAGGSNTNWFATCSSTAECGSGLECWCGICTSTCATECTSSPAGATCETPPGTCQEPLEKSACAVRCITDAQCKDLGAGATCFGSVCRKGPGGGGKVNCESSSSEANDRIQALVKSADQSCTSTADCMEFPSVSCRNHCSIGTVSSAGAVVLEGQIQAIEEEVCKPFAASGCKVTEMRCPFPGIPTCVAGKCEHGTPGQTSDGGAGSSCADLSARMNANAEDAALAADHACSTSADCKVTMLVNQCFESCSYEATSSSGARTLESALSAMETEYCGDFSAAGCKVTRLPCVPPPTATCQSGKCALP